MIVLRFQLCRCGMKRMNMSMPCHGYAPLHLFCEKKSLKSFLFFSHLPEFNNIVLFFISHFCRMQTINAHVLNACANVIFFFLLAFMPSDIRYSGYTIHIQIAFNVWQLKIESCTNAFINIAGMQFLINNNNNFELIVNADPCLLIVIIIIIYMCARQCMYALIYISIDMRQQFVCSMRQPLIRHIDKQIWFIFE